MNERVMSFLRSNAVLVFLFLIILVTGIVKPVFLSSRNIVNILGQISVLGIMSLGMILVVISGGIDLSVGMILSLVAVSTAKLIVFMPGMPLMVPIAIGLVIGTILGAINGVIIACSGAQPFVVTLGMMSAYKGIALILTSGYTITNLGEDFEHLGSGRILGVGVNTWIFIMLIGVFLYLIKYTKWGRFCFAIGGSESTAYLSGIPVKRHKIMVYGLNGLMTAAAAILFSARIGSALPLMGSGYELQSIAAVVIGGVSLSGGRGKLQGALLGVLLLGVIQNSLNLMRIDTYWQYIVFGLIIVLAITAYKKQGE